MTVNGVTTDYAYNVLDQLVSTSGARSGAVLPCENSGLVQATSPDSPFRMTEDMRQKTSQIEAPFPYLFQPEDHLVGRMCGRRQDIAIYRIPVKGEAHLRPGKSAVFDLVQTATEITLHPGGLPVEGQAGFDVSDGWGGGRQSKKVPE